ncbi:hypothetical protein DXC81_11375, partial [Collinsella tanakaei]
TKCVLPRRARPRSAATGALGATPELFMHAVARAAGARRLPTAALALPIIPSAVSMLALSTVP